MKGEAAIELVEGEEGKKGLFMVGIEIEDMDEEIAKLKLKGVELTVDPSARQEALKWPF